MYDLSLMMYLSVSSETFLLKSDVLFFYVNYFLYISTIIKDKAYDASSRI